MYISVEVRDALCEAGVIVCAMFLIAAAIMFIVPWAWRRTSFVRGMLLVRLRLWVKYRRNIARIRRAHRRFKAAEREYDRLLSERWREKEEWKRQNT